MASHKQYGIEVQGIHDETCRPKQGGAPINKVSATILPSKSIPVPALQPHWKMSFEIVYSLLNLFVRLRNKVFSVLLESIGFEDILVSVPCLRHALMEGKVRP